MSSLADVFGRHDFLIRRLHSLTGLVPVGAYMTLHIIANASIIDGPSVFQYVVDIINTPYESALLFLEWTFIFIPILFHGLIGLLIVTRGKRNVGTYTYGENIRYTLQRATGVIALLFILYHVFHMHGWLRFEWWHETIRPLGGAQFDPKAAPATAAAAIQASPVILIVYVVGVLASVYHFANGLWTMGITWGAWTSPKAQQWAKVPCAALGIGLAVAGMLALYGMATTPIGTSPPQQPAAATVVGPAESETSLRL